MRSITGDAASRAPVPVTRARRRAARAFTLWAVVLFLCVAGLLITRTLVGRYVPGKPHAPAWGLVDFRDAIYYPVVALLDGNNPYDAVAYAGTYPVGNTFPPYLPHTLLVHLPFGLMSSTAAAAAYLLTTALLTLLLAVLSLRLARLRPSWSGVFLIAALILLSRPGYWNLYLGQYSATLALGCYAALHWAATRPGLAALGVAVAMLKPTYGLPLIVMMLAMGHARSVVAGIAVSGALSAAVAAVIIRNVGGLGAFLDSLGSSRASFGMDPGVDPTLSTYRVDAVALIGRWIGEPLSGAGETLVLVTVLGVAVLALHHVRTRAWGSNVTPGPLSVAIVCSAVLLCTYHQTYDLVLLAAPATAMAAGALASGRAVPGWTRWALGASLVALASNYLASGTALARLGLRGGWWVAIASLNGAAVLVILGICISLALRRQRGAPHHAPTPIPRNALRSSMALQVGPDGRDNGRRAPELRIRYGRSGRQQAASSPPKPPR
jgi:hypothetical protein